MPSISFGQRGPGNGPGQHSPTTHSKEEMTVPQTHPVTEEADIHEAAAIRPADADEAERLARVEFDRLLALLESLDADDWERPTYCTRWTVRQIVSHLAGATAIFDDRDRAVARSESWLQGKADEPARRLRHNSAALPGWSAEAGGP